MAGDEEWRKNVDTHKMSREEVKKAGVEASIRPPGHHPGEVLHQRRGLSFCNYATIAVGGFLMVAAIGYVVLYTRKKPEASARDVAKVMTNTARPEDTHPRS